MQSVNNDMDDLFRRAAENYPLNSASSDWNKVMQGLGPGKSGGVSKSDRNLESFFWLAAIFLVIVCTTFIQKTEHILQPGSPTTHSNSKNIPVTTIPGKEMIPGQNIKEGSVLVNAEKSLVHKRKPSQAVGSPAKAESPFLIPPKENIHQQETATETHELNSQPGIVELEIVRKSEDQLPPGDQIEMPVKKYQLTKVGVSDERITVKKGFLQRVYTGIIAGPDVSTVKSQRISNAGYSIGLLAGYQFNKRLSLESGVFWDRKEYYSTGKYFNKGKLGLPQHAKVIDVDGYCQMFEIPVNLRFNWVQNSNQKLFATSGISSYLMKREDYDYSYDYYGTQYNYYKQYKNASRNWASIINFSIGYERKIGNAGSLRIEPYLKLSLKGVGVGDLPLGSKGVFVGFTRPIR